MATAENGAARLPEQPLHEYPEAKVMSKVFSHYGADTAHYNALSWIADDIVILPAGKFVLFVHVKSGLIESQDGPVDGGVGVAAAHPSRQYYVVGERTPRNPRLCVYEWPSRKLLSALEGGAVVGYAACAFNLGGSRMATVAAAPDFTLAIWSWDTKSLLLRSKCFGADVQSVAFSRFDSSVIVTGGESHIKLWLMAQTFTGPKLQGTLGKFGRLDISNITGFAALADGTVLSGAENGCLLLWAGDLVRCSFARVVGSRDDIAAHAGDMPDIVPCHDGPINAVQLIYDAKIVVTAGSDGFIRYWARAEIEAAEGSGQPPFFELPCLLETCVSELAQIHSMTLCEDTNEWAVLDFQGAIHTSALPALEELQAGTARPPAPEPPCVRFSGGAITCSAISPVDHTIITGGEDGVVRLVDYVRGVELYSTGLPKSAGNISPSVTALYVFRRDSEHVRFLVGYSNGIVRLMQRDGTFSVEGQWKPLTDAVLAFAVAADERRLAVVGVDGTVFFFSVGDLLDALAPLRFCLSPLPAPLCAAWDEAAGDACLVGHEGGQILSISAPTPHTMDYKTSFEFPCTYALVAIRQRRLPPEPQETDPYAREPVQEDALEEQDNGPWPVVLLRQLPDGALAVGMDKEELLYAYRGSVRYPSALALPPLPPTGIEPAGYVEEPGPNLCHRGCVPRAVYLVGGRVEKTTKEKTNEVLVVCDRSRVLLRDLEHAEQLSLVSQAHDSTTGYITGAFVSHDGAMVVTSGTDGLVVAQLRDGYPAPRADAVEAVPVPQPVARPRASADPSPMPVLSIEAQRIADDAAQEEEAENRRRAKCLTALQGIHDELNAVLERNELLPPEARLGPGELELDESVRSRLAEERQRRVAAAREEFVVDAARDEVLRRMLRRRFVDNLLCDRFLVHAFSTNLTVASLRTVNPDAAIARLEWELAQLSAPDSDEEASPCEENAASADGCGDAAMPHEMRRGSEEVNGAAAAGVPVAGSDVRLSGGISASISHQLNKLDARRLERRRRREGYEQLLQRQPDSSVEDTQLEREVEAALHKRGECLLRTNAKYVGAYEFRPTAEAKLRRMINTEKLLVKMRGDFNERLLAARAEKKVIIATINGLRRRVAAINEVLKDRPGESVPPLSLLSDEEPEDLFRVDRDALDAYAKRKEADKAKEEQLKKAQRGFGADLAGSLAGDGESSGKGVRTSQVSGRASTSRRETVRSKNSRNFSRLERGSRQSTVTVMAASRERMDNELQVKLETLKPSPLEAEEQAMQQAKMLAERNKLLAAIQHAMATFDRKLEALFDSRVAVDADLCLADSRLLLLFREYQLLMVYRSREKELRKQLRSTQGEQAALQRKAQALRDAIRVSESNVAALAEKAKKQKQEAESFVASAFPSERVPYVLRVLHRHIKRRKGIEDNEDDDDITSDDDDDGEEVDDDLGEELCPANCDRQQWGVMLSHREVGLDLAEALEHEKASRTQATSSLRDMEAAAVERQQTLAAQRQDMTSLDVEKRLELNRLSTAVFLRCDQVRYLDAATSSCPQDLRKHNVVVIADDELTRLNTRISELAVEKLEKRDTIGSMAADLHRLQQNKIEARKLHAEWEEKVHEVMMLKFGQPVDLEALEARTTSRRIETRKEELRRLELQWEREVRKCENHLLVLRDELQNKVITNTHILQDYGDSEQDRQDVERAVSRAAHKTVQKHGESRVATRQDRDNLRTLIEAQQDEMSALQAEIRMLRQKGGHAYSSTIS